MSSNDPVIIVIGSSAKIKLGLKHFNGISKREYDDPSALMNRVVVKNAAGTVLQSFDFPDGKFSVEFLSLDQQP